MQERSSIVRRLRLMLWLRFYACGKKGTWCNGTSKRSRGKLNNIVFILIWSEDNRMPLQRVESWRLRAETALTLPKLGCQQDTTWDTWLTWAYLGPANHFTELSMAPSWHLSASVLPVAVCISCARTIRTIRNRTDSLKGATTWTVLVPFSIAGEINCSYSRRYGCQWHDFQLFGGMLVKLCS